MRSTSLLDKRDPNFRPGWGTYALQGVIRPELAARVGGLLRDKTISYAFRTLLLDALEGSTVADVLAHDLEAILTDRSAIYGVRHRAGEALAKCAASVDWPSIVAQLVELNDDNSARLAVDMLSIAGFHHFDDAAVADTVFAYGSQRSSVIGRLHAFERDLPAERIDVVLDLLAARAGKAREDKEEGYNGEDVTDVAMTLIARRLGLGSIDPIRLWTWLEPFRGGHGYHRTVQEEIAAWLKANDDVRRAIQRHLLLDRPGDSPIRMLAWPMHRTVPGIAPTPGDVSVMLNTFGTPARSPPPEVARWKDVLYLTQHGPDAGAEVRAAARAFAGARKGLHQFLDRLAEACRDELLKMIGDYPLGILCAPEGHLANDNRADVQCTIGELMLPIEVKGQWHADLWTAAATQLDRKYASDWRADRRGIYLVFWFGRNVRVGKQPRTAPDKAVRPQSAQELTCALCNALPPALIGPISIIVIDLTLQRVSQ
jgi:hypothetical protein